MGQRGERAAYRAWTPAEKELLLLKFGTMTMTELALLFPGRTEMGVQSRAAMMKLTGGKRRQRKQHNPFRQLQKPPETHPAVIQAETRRKKYAYDRTPCSERELGYDMG